MSSYHGDVRDDPVRHDHDRTARRDEAGDASRSSVSEATLDPRVPALLRTAGARLKLWLVNARSTGWTYLVTTSIVVLAWCNYYARWPGTRSFELPVSYVGGGDTLLVMGIAKGFSELPPPWNLEVHRLNAPFGADWNDYPHTEKLIFYAWGGLLRFLSLGAAANVVSLFAHVSAALAFAWTARRLGRTPPVAHAAALLFAFSPFMMGRALEHVNVSILWHIPLLLLLAVRIASDAHVPSVGWRLCAYALLVATSLQNPYYPPIAFQILALATLRSLIVGRNKVAAFGLKVLAVGVTSFLFGQLNVYLRRWFAGANDAFSGRSLESIQLWALRIPDLFMPLQHVIAPWERFARSHYFEAGNPPTENTDRISGPRRRRLACRAPAALALPGAG